MTRKLARRAVWLLVLAGVAAAVWFATRPRPISVTTHSVARGPVASTVANTRAGTLRARRRASLAPAIGGRVVSLGAREGDTVTPGQELLRLWADDLRAQLALTQVESAQAKALAEEACQRADLAERESKRQLELQQDGIASEEQVDRAVSQAHALRAACAAAEAAVDLPLARATTIQARLDQTVLHAPFAGIIAELNAEIGEFVTPSPVGIPMPPAIDLIDPTSLYVEAPLDEVDAPSVRVDMPARITLDAFGARTFAGTVARVAPYVLDREKQARTVDIEVTFDDPAVLRDLLPGYSADVEVILDTREDVLRIPTEAILEDDRVLVLDPATNLIRAVTITTGLTSWRWTEVLSGLNPSDQLILSVDRDGVAPGVEATPEPPEPER